MKKIIIINVLLALVIITALPKMKNEREISNLCKTAFDNESMDILEGVTINSSYDSEEGLITYTILNDLDDYIYCGLGVVLEKKVKGVWYEIPYRPDYLLRAIGGRIDTQSARDFLNSIHSWEQVSPLEGEYRLVKEICVSERPLESDIFYISTQFTIE
jgi:hypothetical protein